MDEVEIEMIRAQPPQGFFHGSHDVAARSPPRVDVRPLREIHLAGQDQFLPVRGRQLAQDLLRTARLVHVGAIEEVDPRIAAAAEHGLGGFFIRVPPKRHRSEAKG